jgi:glycine/D-amino acid oxidase-like deaminating enzyme
MAKQTAIVIGAGIAGLATARALSLKGFSVQVFDKTQQAVGASIRNFGMVWPIGQTSGKLYERAMRSRNIWKEISNSGAFWHEPAGSLHVAHHADEWKVLQELYEIFKKERNVELITPKQIADRSGAVVQNKLLGGNRLLARLFTAAIRSIIPLGQVCKLCNG